MPGAELPRVPAGLRDLMKSLTKEVLREKPPDIYEFSAQYFQSMLGDSNDIMEAQGNAFEPATNYETIFKNHERNQAPLVLVYSIIPATLTELIKEFIKAVLRAKPKNICAFAVQYFRGLHRANETRLNRNVEYGAYENYFKSKERFSFTPYVKCTCGRTFGEGMTQSHYETSTTTTFSKTHSVETWQKEERTVVINGGGSAEGTKSSPLATVSENDVFKEEKVSSHRETQATTTTTKMTTSTSTKNEKLNEEEKADEQQSLNTEYEDEKYIHAIYIIQRFVRKILRAKRLRSEKPSQKLSHSTTNILADVADPQPIEKPIEEPIAENKMSQETAAIIIQRSLRMLFNKKLGRQRTPIVPPLENFPSKDDTNDNVSEAASYTSASTAFLSAGSAADPIEVSALDGVTQKTIFESDEVDLEHDNEKRNVLAETSNQDQINKPLSPKAMSTALIMAESRSLSVTDESDASKETQFLESEKALNASKSENLKDISTTTSSAEILEPQTANDDSQKHITLVKNDNNDGSDLIKTDTQASDNADASEPDIELLITKNHLEKVEADLKNKEEIINSSKEHSENNNEVNLQHVNGATSGVISSYDNDKYDQLQQESVEEVLEKVLATAEWIVNPDPRKNENSTEQLQSEKIDEHEFNNIPEQNIEHPKSNEIISDKEVQERVQEFEEGNENILNKTFIKEEKPADNRADVPINLTSKQNINIESNGGTDKLEISDKESGESTDQASNENEHDKETLVKTSAQVEKVGAEEAQMDHKQEIISNELLDQLKDNETEKDVAQEVPASKVDEPVNLIRQKPNELLPTTSINTSNVSPDIELPMEDGDMKVLNDTIEISRSIPTADSNEFNIVDVVQKSSDPEKAENSSEFVSTSEEKGFSEDTIIDISQHDTEVESLKKMIHDTKLNSNKVDTKEENQSTQTPTLETMTIDVVENSERHLSQGLSEKVDCSADKAKMAKSSSENDTDKSSGLPQDDTALESAADERIIQESSVKGAVLSQEDASFATTANEEVIRGFSETKESSLDTGEVEKPISSETSSAVSQNGAGPTKTEEEQVNQGLSKTRESSLDSGELEKPISSETSSAVSKNDVGPTKNEEDQVIQSLSEKIDSFRETGEVAQPISSEKSSSVLQNDAGHAKTEEEQVNQDLSEKKDSSSDTGEAPKPISSETNSVVPQNDACSAKTNEEQMNQTFSEKEDFLSEKSELLELTTLETSNAIPQNGAAPAKREEEQMSKDMESFSATKSTNSKSTSSEGNGALLEDATQEIQVEKQINQIISEKGDSLDKIEVLKSTSLDNGAVSQDGAAIELAEEEKVPSVEGDTSLEMSKSTPKSAEQDSGALSENDMHSATSSAKPLEKNIESETGIETVALEDKNIPQEASDVLAREKRQLKNLEDQNDDIVPEIGTELKNIKELESDSSDTSINTAKSAIELEKNSILPQTEQYDSNRTLPLTENKKEPENTINQSTDAVEKPEQQGQQISEACDEENELDTLTESSDITEIENTVPTTNNSEIMVSATEREKSINLSTDFAASLAEDHNLLHEGHETEVESLTKLLSHSKKPADDGEVKDNTLIELYNQNVVEPQAAETRIEKASSEYNSEVETPINENSINMDSIESKIEPQASIMDQKEALIDSESSFSVNELSKKVEASSEAFEQITEDQFESSSRKINENLTDSCHTVQSVKTDQIDIQQESNIVETTQNINSVNPVKQDNDNNKSAVFSKIICDDDARIESNSVPELSNEKGSEIANKGTVDTDIGDRGIELINNKDGVYSLSSKQFTESIKKPDTVTQEHETEIDSLKKLLSVTKDADNATPEEVNERDIIEQKPDLSQSTSNVIFEESAKAKIEPGIAKHDVPRSELTKETGDVPRTTEIAKEEDAFSDAFVERENEKNLLNTTDPAESPNEISSKTDICNSPTETVIGTQNLDKPRSATGIEPTSTESDSNKLETTNLLTTTNSQISSNKNIRTNKRLGNEPTDRMIAEIHLKSFRLPDHLEAVPWYEALASKEYYSDGNSEEKENLIVISAVPHADVASDPNMLNESTRTQNILANTTENELKEVSVKTFVNDRSPTYLFGAEDQVGSKLPRRAEKGSTTFIIPFEKPHEARDVTKMNLESNKLTPRSEKEDKIQFSSGTDKNPVSTASTKKIPTNLNLNDNEFIDNEHEIELESPTKLFAELNQFDSDEFTLEEHLYALNETYTLDDATRLLSISDLHQSPTKISSDETVTEQSVNTSTSSLDQGLQTIIEVNEAETPHELSLQELNSALSTNTATAKDEKDRAKTETLESYVRSQPTEVDRELNKMSTLVSAAIIIQKNYRKYMSRKNLAKELDSFISDSTQNICAETNQNTIIPTSTNENTFISKEEEGTFYKNIEEMTSTENLNITKLETLVQAAVAIQRTYRGYLARKQFNQNKSTLAKRGSTAGTRENIQNIDLEINQEDAITPIVPSMESLIQSAIIIQTTYRKYLARKKRSQSRLVLNDVKGYTMNENNQKFSIADVHKSALIIQRIYRGYIARKHRRAIQSQLALLSTMPTPPNHEPESSDDLSNESKSTANTPKSMYTSMQAAIIIQKAFKRYLSYKKFKDNEVRQHDIESDNFANTPKSVYTSVQAAIVIQKAFKRYLSYKKSQKDETNQALADDKLVDEKGIEEHTFERSESSNVVKNAAVIVIQNAYRNFASRQKRAANNLLHSEERTSPLLKQLDSEENVENEQKLTLSNSLDNIDDMNYDRKTLTSSDTYWNESQTTEILVDQDSFSSQGTEVELKLTASGEGLEPVTLSNSGNETNEILEDPSPNVKVQWFVGNHQIVSSQDRDSSLVLDDSNTDSSIITPTNLNIDGSSTINNLNEIPTALASFSSDSNLSSLEGTTHEPSSQSILLANISKEMPKTPLKLLNTKVSAETDESFVVNPVEVQDASTSGSDLQLEDMMETAISEREQEMLTLQSGNMEVKDDFLILRTLLSNFIITERQFCDSDRQEEQVFVRLSEFLDKPNESDINYEKLEESPCIKKTISDTTIKDREISQAAVIEGESSGEDSMEAVAEKLREADEAIVRMQQRRASTARTDSGTRTSSSRDLSFDAPDVQILPDTRQIFSPDTEEESEGIILNRLQREETRESSAQSADIVYGGDATPEQNASFDEFTASVKTSSLKRMHTIAVDDTRSLFKSVTIDHTVQYIEPSESETALITTTPSTSDTSSSFYLDDSISDNIREKMLAYSVSEADSDYIDMDDDAFGNNAHTSGTRLTKARNDFNISTALADTFDSSSTASESTIVSAATKIQAGARGFLARRRLRRISGGTKSSTVDGDYKASFGNDAISESLERLVEDEAAKKIQRAYRSHSRKAKRPLTSSARGRTITTASGAMHAGQDPLRQTASLESTLAARRMTLQRGDALRNDSTHEEEQSINNEGKSPLIINQDNLMHKPQRTGDKNVSYNPENSETVKTTLKSSTNVSSTNERLRRINENKLKWMGIRQNSMPVQIDTEILRVIPKHMRKRIKSAEGNEKKTRNRRILKD